MMDIDSLTVKEVREISAMFGANKSASHSFEIGKKYLIRTVTFYFIGELVAVTDTDLVLNDVCWIADTGKLSTALERGSVSEAERLPDNHIVGRGGLIDASVWAHDTPKTP